MESLFIKKQSAVSVVVGGVPKVGFGGVSRVVGFVSYQTVSFSSFKCERQLDLQLQDCGLEPFREF